MGQLLLESHALGDVAGVQHDAAHVAVPPQVGDVRLEVAPLAEPVRIRNSDLVRLAVLAGRLDGGAVVGVHEAREARPSSSARGAPEHPDDRLADVTAAAVPEARARGRSTR